MEDLLSNVKEQHVSPSDFLRDGRLLILDIKICKNPSKHVQIILLKKVKVSE